MDKMQIYNHLPIWGQNLACYVEGRRIKKTRYSALFWKKLNEYEDRDKWSYERKCEYRDKRLRSMVRYCYLNVPYYHGIFEQGGINPESIKCLDDLKLLPILTKDIINKQPEKFISTALPQKKMITAHTSGTTGAGFIFMTTQSQICEQWAVWWRYRRKLEIKFDTLSGNFGTKFVVPAIQTEPPFWRYNLPCHQVYFSAFHENYKNLKYYIDEIEKRKITWLHGYPSLLSELANAVICEGNQNLKNQIKFVTIGAENLLEHQRTVIEQAFGVHVYQHYGLSEGVSNFSENKHGQIVVDEDFAATEFVEKNGIMKIIGTSLTNRAMPLLRYDTKDTAEFQELPGIGRMVKSLDGRIEDYVALPSGKKIGKLDHVFKDAVHLEEVQIRQAKDYSVKVLYVPRDDDYMVDLQRADYLFGQTFGEPMKIVYQKTDKVEKAKNGKLRFIVSELNDSTI